MATKITVNGITITGSGTVVISGGKIMVEGKDVTPDAKEINISVEGNIETLDVDDCNRLHITGNCGSVRTISGDVNLDGDVIGSVTTVSGYVDCLEIKGSVSTVSGDIKTKKA